MGTNPVQIQPMEFQMLADNIRLKNINHITYNVKDKDAALKWYEDILGVKQIP